MKAEDTPFFSVVIPVYNRCEMLQSALESLVNQTFTNFEVIVVDDGSTEDIESIINSSEIPEISYIYQNRGGGGAARNRGILASKGRYISFLDSDDLFFACKLHEVYDEIRRSNATMIFSYARVVRGPRSVGRKPSRPIDLNETFAHYSLVAREPAQTSTLVVERELAARVQFDASLPKFQDIDFGLRLAHSGAIISFIPRELTIWRDTHSMDRIGSTKVVSVGEGWLKKNRGILTKKEIHAFRANLISYEISENNSFLSIYYIFCGFLLGGVSFRRSIHSFLRAFIPQNIYRILVNMSLRGGGPQQSRPFDVGVRTCQPGSASSDKSEVPHL